MSTPLPASALPLGPGVRVLTAHASGLVALEKPAGVLAHPNAPGLAKNCLLAAAYDLDAECYKFDDAAGVHRRVWLLNRLDSPTSGVILVATDEATAKTVKAMFAEREIDKTYHAVVKGARLLPAKGVWRDSLKKSHGAAGGFVRAAGGSGGLEAVSHFEWRRANRALPGLSLVELQPKTGRTHQLRIQCSLHTHPIAGDKTYGDFTMNKTLAARDARFDRLFLHCSRTAFSYRHGGKDISFVAESPLPEAFESILAEGAAPKVSVSDRISIRLKPGKGAKK